MRPVEYAGYLYAIFAVWYGPYGQQRKPRIHSWKLLPPALYAGQTTTVYHDDEEILTGRRERGDHTGLIVSVRGEPMVCAERARFVLDLPETRPLSLAEAKQHDERQRASGWRAFGFRGKEPEWFSLGGHPVAVYRDHSTLHVDHATLLWKAGGETHELWIDSDVSLSPPEADCAAPTDGQLRLF